MKVITRNILGPWYYSVYRKPFSEKVRSFWRKGWIHAPEVMASTILALFGSSLYFYKLFTTTQEDMRCKYLMEPRVFRPNDPAVARIKKTSQFD